MGRAAPGGRVKGTSKAPPAKGQGPFDPIDWFRDSMGTCGIAPGEEAKAWILRFAQDAGGWGIERVECQSAFHPTKRETNG